MKEFSQQYYVKITKISSMENAMKIPLILWVMEQHRGKRDFRSPTAKPTKRFFIFFFHIIFISIHKIVYKYGYNTFSVPGAFYNELRSNVNFTVDDSYYSYLATSLNYRSDLVRIVSRLWQFYNKLTRKH